MSCGSYGLRRPNGSHPPGVVRTRVLPGGEPARVVSRSNLERLADYTLAVGRLDDQFAVVYGPDAIGVEFVAASGRTKALVTLQLKDLREAGDDDLVTVRPSSASASRNQRGRQEGVTASGVPVRPLVLTVQGRT